RRTLPRASGTAMVVSKSMIVNATINSTKVNPRWFLRRMALSNVNVESWGRGQQRVALRVPHRQIRDGDARGPFADCLEIQGHQGTRSGNASGAREPIEIDGCGSGVVHDVLGKNDLLAIVCHEIAANDVVEAKHLGVVLDLHGSGENVLPVG